MKPTQKEIITLPFAQHGRGVTGDFNCTKYKYGKKHYTV